jgi:rubrerythrin
MTNANRPANVTMADNLLLIEKIRHIIATLPDRRAVEKHEDVRTVTCRVCGTTHGLAVCPQCLESTPHIAVLKP